MLLDFLHVKLVILLCDLLAYKPSLSSMLIVILILYVVLIVN
jgi:hypothetical protein